MPQMDSSKINQQKIGRVAQLVERSLSMLCGSLCE